MLKIHRSWATVERVNGIEFVSVPGKSESELVKERGVCCLACGRNKAETMYAYVHEDRSMDPFPICWRCVRLGMECCNEEVHVSLLPLDAIDDMVLEMSRRQSERIARLRGGPFYETERWKLWGR